MVEPEATDDNIEIRLMYFSCWITEVTGTLPEYEIITAFLREQRLSRRDLILRFYVHCLFCYNSD